MTWYASDIITTGAPAVSAAIKRNPLFCDHAFRVTNPIHHNWHNPDVVHDVPPDGLVFIRPICDPADHIAEWNDNEILSWEQFEHSPGVDVRLTPEMIAKRHSEFEVSLFPAIEVLRVAKKLSVDTQSPVAFYYCFWWGGNVEVEYAWLFDERERLVIRQTKDVPPDVDRLLEIDADQETDRNDHVLCRTLRSLSCELPTPFFVPYTRGFGWEGYRL